MNPQFDRVADFYYPLSHLVFGRSQQTAQIHFLRRLTPGSRVLVVGGGNGGILPPLAGQVASEGEIIFVESSEEMLVKARKKDVPFPVVQFVHSPIENFLETDPGFFDAIITGFFFDLFAQEKAGDLHNRISACLKPGGLWFDTDFQLEPRSWWQKRMMQTMYTLFRPLVNLRTDKLPDLRAQWRAGFTEIAAETFYRNFIITRLYRKKPILE